METATTATSTSTSSTLRHRPVVGKANNKEDGVPSTETEAAAAAAGSTSGTSKGMNGGSVAIKPPPRSPPTAGGPTRLGEGSEEEDDGVSGGTPSTTPPPPYDEDTAKSKLLALSRAFSSYPGEVIQTPVTGPAKIAMEDIYPNPNLVLQLLDFLILFIIVHYVQFFYGGLLFMCWRSHSAKPLLVAAAVYLPLYFIPVQRMGGWPFTGFMNRPFWRCVQRALQIKIEREVELDPARQYIFGWHPHGILLLSRFAIYGGLWDKLFPGIRFKTLAASPLFWVPPIREVSILLGAVDAGRAFATKALTDGYSVSLYPGGSKEIYTTNPYTAETKLVLRIRQGFIKLALRYGLPLVPIYIYGEKYAYHRLEHHTGLANILLSTLRVPFLVFWGRWCTFLPRAGTQVAVVVGRPIEVPRVVDPGPEVVAEYLDRYCREVEALFHRHKHKYGQPGESIEIS